MSYDTDFLCFRRNTICYILCFQAPFPLSWIRIQLFKDARDPELPIVKFNTYLRYFFLCSIPVVRRSLSRTQASMPQKTSRMWDTPAMPERCFMIISQASQSSLQTGCLQEMLVFPDTNKRNIGVFEEVGSWRNQKWGFGEIRSGVLAKCIKNNDVIKLHMRSKQVRYLGT